MHDGQNLFDPLPAFVGERGVATALPEPPRKDRRATVAGITNARIERMSEYSLFVDRRIGGGLGDRYLDWIEQTVKPLIDERFRTIRGTEGTLIGGSSLGGLISLYAFFRAPARYGSAAVLSPALWFGD